MSVPGIATSTVAMSVSPIERPDALWTIAPEITPPATAPRSAPTIPAQKRSGTNTVKCHRATATVNQTTAAISFPLRSSMPPVLSAAALLALAARFLAFGLGAVTLCRRPRALPLRDSAGAIPAVDLHGRSLGAGLDLGRLGLRFRGRRCFGRRRRGGGPNGLALRLGLHVG